MKLVYSIKRKKIIKLTPKIKLIIINLIKMTTAILRSNKKKVVDN